MRIFYAAHDQGNSNPASLTWFHNLYLPLQDLADEVIRFDFDLFQLAIHQDFTRTENLPFIEYFRPKLENELLRQIEEAHNEKPVDLFFSYFSSSFCSVQVIEKIKAMGIITVNWFCNASYQFYLVKDLAPAYHYCLVPEKYRIEDYKSVGANPIYCQEAANPFVYKPYLVKQEIDISFAGTRYGDRAEYINTLYYNSLGVKVFGEGWKKTANTEYFSFFEGFRQFSRQVYHHFKGIKLLPSANISGFINDEELVKLYSRSKINLGFTNCWLLDKNAEPIQQVRLRDFEIPMSGGFYLTQYNKELADFFVPDKEIVFFEGKKELIEKAKYYLAHQDEREVIRKAGYERAINDHTWQKRLSDIFLEAGLLNIKKSKTDG